MNEASLDALAQCMIEPVSTGQILPERQFTAVQAVFSQEGIDIMPALLRAWTAAGKAEQDLHIPLLLSRGYSSNLPEEELRHYLPEEKILINKELFRKHLGTVNFNNLDPSREQRLIDELTKESIGLRRDDVLLYYNLIKTNKLAEYSAQARSAQGSSPTQEDPVQAAQTILRLADKNLGLTTDALVRINNGRTIEHHALVNLIADAIRRRRINPAIMANFLGKKTDKFILKAKEFIHKLGTSRGEDNSDMLAMATLYLLISGSDQARLDTLNLSPPLMSFLTDKIGRVRTIYYAGMLFIQTTMYVLFAQVYEISAKYHEADKEQQTKLSRLYGAEERLTMLVTNAANLGFKRITEFKTEGREIQTAFKRMALKTKDLVESYDLFNVDYR